MNFQLVGSYNCKDLPGYAHETASTQFLSMPMIHASYFSAE